MNKKPTAQVVEKFVVRLPPGMRMRISDVSKLSRRSMNSEIVACLEHSLSLYPKTLNNTSVDDYINEEQAEYLSAHEFARTDIDLLLSQNISIMSEDKKRALLALLSSR